MIAKNCSTKDMERALSGVNKKYKGNVEFNRFEPHGKHIAFTLRVKSSKGPGHRVGFYNSRRLVSACWHVHGHFFEELFKVNPEAVVISRWVENGKITRYGGNWQDRNIGSMMRPLMLSEACDCE